jgi:hypothetical protein
VSNAGKFEEEYILIHKNFFSTHTHTHAREGKCEEERAKDIKAKAFLCVFWNLFHDLRL